MTVDVAALAALFAAGADGFIGERLARFLELSQPDNAAARAAAAADSDNDNASDNDVPAADGPGGPDAWQGEATRRVASLWSGSPDDVEYNQGCPPPPELAALWALTRGYDKWSSFTEMRLDVELLGRFDDAENVFELCVLSDQLNYLGTALAEAFSGAICFATYGDGDSWHIDLVAADVAPPIHTVTRYAHDDHAFEQEPVGNLNDAVFLAALVHAFREDWLTDEEAAAALLPLHGRVAPSWHFSIDDIDPDFVASDAPAAATAAYLAARSAWIFKVLGADLVSGLADVPSLFASQLNEPITPELFVGRLKAMKTRVSTALYTMWRAYLFDEPELEDYLVAGRRHAGRLARDGARLIDELRAGRQVLGKHSNWSERLAKFRALDLDPRRAEARADLAAAAAAAADVRRQQIIADLATIDDDSLAAFIAAHAETEVLEAILARVVTLLPARAQHALDVLARPTHQRDGNHYSDEVDEVIAVLTATSSHPALQAFALALLEHGTAETKPARYLGNTLLTTWAKDGAVNEAIGLQLVARAQRQTNDEASRHGLNATLQLLGAQPWSATVATSFAAFVEPWLPTLPTEGGFDTALHFDSLNGRAAITTGTVLRNAPHVMRTRLATALLPMATTASPRMDITLTQGALGLALLDPTVFSSSVFAGVLNVFKEGRNEHASASAALAIAVAAAGQDRATCAAWGAQVVDGTLSSSSIECAALRVVAQHALGVSSSDEVDALLMRLCTDTSSKEEYVQKRHALMQRIHLTLPQLVPTTALLEVVADSGNFDVADWACALLQERGVTQQRQQRITWLDVEHIDDEARIALLADLTIGGRQHAARALVRVPRDDDAPAIRRAIEAAVLQVAAGVQGPRELQRDEARLLIEGVGALLRLPTSPSTLAVLSTLLLHNNRDVKAPVLRAAPDDLGLQAGMRHVLNEDYGWQASTAKDWLHGRGLLHHDEVANDA